MVSQCTNQGQALPRWPVRVRVALQNACIIKVRFGEKERSEHGLSMGTMPRRLCIAAREASNSMVRPRKRVPLQRDLRSRERSEVTIRLIRPLRFPKHNWQMQNFV